MKADKNPKDKKRGGEKNKDNRAKHLVLSYKKKENNSFDRVTGGKAAIVVPGLKKAGGKMVLTIIKRPFPKGFNF